MKHYITQEQLDKGAEYSDLVVEGDNFREVKFTLTPTQVGQLRDFYEAHEKLTSEEIETFLISLTS